MAKADRGAIVVAGAGGRLGRALGRIWHGRPEIVWQSRRTVDARAGPAVACDPLAEPCKLAAAIDGAAAFVCLWGLTPSGGGDPAGNATLARVAAEVAAAADIPRGVYLSSAAVYGPGDGPFPEDGPTDAATPYGRAKRAAEIALRDAPGPTRWSVLRLANVVGADSLPLFSRGAVTLDRFADGRGPVRSYATPALVARAIDAVLAAADPPDVLNVAGRRPQAMDALLAAAGRDWTWRPAPNTARARVTLDTTRLYGLIAARRADEDPRAMVVSARAALP